MCIIISRSVFLIICIFHHTRWKCTGELLSYITWSHIQSYGLIVFICRQHLEATELAFGLVRFICWVYYVVTVCLLFWLITITWLIGWKKQIFKNYLYNNNIHYVQSSIKQLHIWITVHVDCLFMLLFSPFWLLFLILCNRANILHNLS